ncbi:hypothetical protein Agabi119p4_6093 [Agaricus bisporus var. burnettii]|uniref:Pyridoxal phosphate homeostasis protein n=1 Tax=Agaricus bisporus var. burnettii TaxID=192524 RepID=A0A8H7KGB2_AGABI|nr:hypothetical protein Agabi119p4_6093 [Agaricus bisporus var. burnettii]
MSSIDPPPLQPAIERAEELESALAEIRDRVRRASSGTTPTLIAVSKYKPASDIMACYEQRHYDFGENYSQELVDKAAILPRDIRWHFIGALQSNKAKILASIPNLYCVQTLTSAKTASALNKAIPEDRTLRVLVQVNTSGEESKSGLPPLGPDTHVGTSELAQLVVHVVTKCPRLRFEGLMTIGALEQSLNASETEKNADFETLKETRDRLKEFLIDNAEQTGHSWGHEVSGKLMLSMGMSGDFEAAIKAGSDIVRVGTGIFGQRPKKEIS